MEPADAAARRCAAASRSRRDSTCATTSRSLEQRLIVRAMESAGGTVAQAARLLGLRRTTLVEKLRKYAMGGSDAVVPES